MIILEKYLTLKNIFTNERVLLSKKFYRFAKFITNQKINLVFAVVGMMHSTRKWYRDNVDNYVEILLIHFDFDCIRQENTKGHLNILFH